MVKCPVGICPTTEYFQAEENQSPRNKGQNSQGTRNTGQQQQRTRGKGQKQQETREIGQRNNSDSRESLAKNKLQASRQQKSVQKTIQQVKNSSAKKTAKVVPKSGRKPPRIPVPVNTRGHVEGSTFDCKGNKPGLYADPVSDCKVNSDLETYLKYFYVMLFIM